MNVGENHVGKGRQAKQSVELLVYRPWTNFFVGIF